MGVPVGSKTASYIMTAKPLEADALAAWTEDNLLMIEASLELLSQGFLPKTFVAPIKPFDGMKRYADGTEWNPGSGEGEYIYYAGAWHKCG